MRPVLLCLLLLLPAGDEFAAGVLAYKEGRFQDALKAFGEAEKAAGNDASAELFHNKALAALRAGELLEAESSAEKAAARGGPEFGAVRDFLLGNAAFTRCEKAEEDAGKPGAEPSAWDPVIAHAESAKSAWQIAAASKPDWPEARRNVERALLKIEELKKKKEEAEKKKKEEDEKKKNESKPDSRPQSQPDSRPQSQPDSRPQSRPESQPDEPKDPKDEPKDPKDQKDKKDAQPVELSPEEVKRLLDKLDDKEKERLKMLRARAQAQGLKVEKDW